MAKQDAAYFREYRRANQERVRAKERARYVRNREAKLAASQMYRASHKEERVAYDAAYQKANKERISERAKLYHASHPEMQQAYSLKRQFNLTLDEYNEMFARQGGVCAVCGQPEKSLNHTRSRVRNLSVDHCHKTGKIRGLLCGKCNSALGHLDDSPAYVEQLLRYIREYG